VSYLQLVAWEGWRFWMFWGAFCTGTVLVGAAGVAGIAADLTGESAPGADSCGVSGLLLAGTCLLWFFLGWP
jgi:hypothetical protein